MIIKLFNDQIFFDVESGIIKYAITSDKTMVIKRRDRLIAIVFYKNGREISPVEKYGKTLIDFKYIYDAVVEMRECYEMIVYGLCDMLSNPSFADVPQNYNTENDGRGTFEKSNDVIVIS